MHPIVKLNYSLGTLLLLFFIQNVVWAQNWQGGRPGGNNGGNINAGHFYGKVVGEDGKGVGYAAVQLFGMRFDTTSKTLKETLIAGQITEDNGDFSLENLPVRGDFTLRISVLGYATTEQTVTFGIPAPQPGGKPQQGGNRQPGSGDQPSSGQRPGNADRGGIPAGTNFDVDLGNITIKVDAQVLEEVVVKGEATNVSLSLDKKIFRVDKDASAVGGTAEDALKNVPSLSVGIDGNLTLRNASPQVFVDGRPTTLSLDQIAADEIESVEVITNPSAKYDASGGQGGIVNIVLKKERRIGYNGNIRTGYDSQNAINAGGNLNMREGKVNFFLNGNYNQRNSTGNGETYRQNLFSNPRTNVLQSNENDFGGSFAGLGAGFDWFADNRNTFTLNANMRRGQFEPMDINRVITDTILSNSTASSEYLRTANSMREFNNFGGAFLYKHLFPKKGKEFTADLNYNQFKSDNSGDFETVYTSNNFVTNEMQTGSSNSSFVTLQADYVEPIGEGAKLEAGVRAAIRNFDSDNGNFVFDREENIWVRRPNFADAYEFEDHVYAAYATFSKEFKKWGYQLGLRAESSQYTGRLPESQTEFVNDFPVSLFPSVFVSQKLNEKDNLQFSYSRRINRPNFFQLIPFTDFSDSLNLRRGNPNLIPEFTNSIEVTYQNIFEGGDNLLISVYYKTASNLITTYQFPENDPILGDVIVSTYQNSNESKAYGAEFTLRNTLSKAIEVTSNLNMYNSRVDASNVESNLVVDQFSWFIKENINVRLPKNFLIQLNGEYRSRAAFSPESGGGRFGGGGGGWRGSSNTAQGYTKAVWFVDFSIRKDIMKRQGTLTASIRDIFKSRKFGSYSESEFFIQDSWRIRNPQVVSLNFSYRFGKPDASLFKRKNTRTSSDGSELMN